jgi:hypothetical protein
MISKGFSPLAAFTAAIAAPAFHPRLPHGAIGAFEGRLPARLRRAFALRPFDEEVVSITFSGSPLAALPASARSPATSDNKSLRLVERHDAQGYRYDPAQAART